MEQLFLDALVFYLKYYWQTTVALGIVIMTVIGLGFWRGENNE